LKKEEELITKKEEQPIIQKPDWIKHTSKTKEEIQREEEWKPVKCDTCGQLFKSNVWLSTLVCQLTS